jgi:hypothetical protein|tara:strand:- start:900 stop:1064 length:165 start_codon:yes stop_codon:yes gene_type:complete
MAGVSRSAKPNRRVLLPGAHRGSEVTLETDSSLQEKVHSEDFISRFYFERSRWS